MNIHTEHQGRPKASTPNDYGTALFFAPVRSKFLSKDRTLQNEDFELIECFALGGQLPASILLEVSPVEATEYLAACVRFAWSDKQTNWIREAFLLTGEGLRVRKSDMKREWELAEIAKIAASIGSRIQEQESFPGGTSVSTEAVKNYLKKLRTELK